MNKNDNKIFIGIDVSKATLDISLSGKHYKINNTAKSILSFIKDSIVAKKIVLCVLESTGGYERLAMQLLSKADVPVHRAHPNKVHAFAKACGHFAKTDKLDSILLERYAAFISDKNVVTEIVSDSILELQALRSVERNLEDNLHAYQCRREHLTGKALIHLNKQVAFIKKQLVEISKDIEELVKNDKDLSSKQHLLTSYKGVGKKTANSLMSELSELGKLNKREIASLVGVVPKTYESGQKIARGHIQGGRFYARKALYMSALVAMRYNERIKIFYERLRANGKSAKIALVAVMHKIIVHLNSMIKNNEIYS
jgi:transposase